MNPLYLLAGAAATALATGGVLYVSSQKSAERERALRLEYELRQEQNFSQAPIAAQPTYQGQTAGGAAASIVDGFLGLYSMLHG